MSSSAPPIEGQEPPVITIEEPIEETARLLRTLQRMLLAHPYAVRAAIRVLVAEGRAFSQTEAGRMWRERLDRSDSIRTARTFWDGLTNPLVGEDLPTTLPTEMLHNFFAAIGLGRAEAALVRAFTGR
jgi:hypothetical protein